MMARFWWSSKREGSQMHWISWDKMCRPKEDGGLGFRNLQAFNLALLAKQGWKLLSDSGSLVASVLKAKYFPACSFLEAKRSRRCSFIWQSLLKGRMVLNQGYRWRVGNGESISISKDPWIPRTPSFKLFSDPGVHVNEKVALLIDPELTRWREDVLFLKFRFVDASAILNISLASSRNEDRIVWHFSKSGVYSVKYGYKLAMSSGIFNNEFLDMAGSSNVDQLKWWKKLWMMPVPECVKLFMWRVCHAALPTTANMFRRKFKISPCCIFCEEEEESICHVFLNCHFARSVWAFDGLDEGLLASKGSFQGWFRDLFNVVNMKLMARISILLWMIWSERNKRVFLKKCSAPEEIASASWNFFQSVSAGVVSSPVSCSLSKAFWRPPVHGQFKVNVDGGINSLFNHSGVGVIIRDWRGLFIGAGAFPLQGVLDPEVVEAIAVKIGLQFALIKGFDNFIIESDCVSVISSLLSNSEDFSLIGNIVSDCKACVPPLSSIAFQFARRECNSVAHSLAKFASRQDVHYEWDSVCPSWLQNLLSLDCNLSS